MAHAADVGTPPARGVGSPPPPTPTQRFAPSRCLHSAPVVRSVELTRFRERTRSGFPDLAVSRQDVLGVVRAGRA